MLLVLVHDHYHKVTEGKKHLELQYEPRSLDTWELLLKILAHMQQDDMHEKFKRVLLTRCSLDGKLGRFATSNRRWRYVHATDLNWIISPLLCKDCRDTLDIKPGPLSVTHLFVSPNASRTS